MSRTISTARAVLTGGSGAPYMTQDPIRSPLSPSINPNIPLPHGGEMVRPIPAVYSNTQGDSETPATSYPTEAGSPVMSLPFKEEGPDDFFPAVCTKTHWDPTAILRKTLPEGFVPQALDPRPWTRICMEYTTAGEDAAAPSINPNIVMPSGGQFYPVSRYVQAIDDESKLRVLDRPLGTCERDQWEPTPNSDMYNPLRLVPERSTVSDPTRIQELAYPRALLRSGPYDCRDANDRIAILNDSDFNFNNATKQNRYKAMNKEYRPAPPAGSLKGSVDYIRNTILANAGSPRAPNGTFNGSLGPPGPQASGPGYLQKFYGNAGGAAVNGENGSAPGRGSVNTKTLGSR